MNAFPSSAGSTFAHIASCSCGLNVIDCTLFAGFDVETYVLDMGTWRKFAPLHVYIVNEFADGVDKCQRIDLEAEQLRKIANALRDNKLPNDDDCHGCFFGSPEIWDQDRSEGNDHAKIFDAAAEWVESTSWGSVTYQASW